MSEQRMLQARKAPTSTVPATGQRQSTTASRLNSARHVQANSAPLMDQAASAGNGRLAAPDYHGATRFGHDFSRVPASAGTAAQPVARVVIADDAVMDEMRPPARSEQPQPVTGNSREVVGTGGPRRSATIQAQLKLGAPGDAYEREANRVAEQVARQEEGLAAISRKPDFDSVRRLVAPRAGSLQSIAVPDSPYPTISRVESGRSTMLRVTSLSAAQSGSGPVPAPLAARVWESKGRGTALPGTMQRSMQAQFGHDFGGVRVKTGAATSDLCHQLGARAFTHGSDIWLGQGESVNDIRLMAHELTHVVQQGAAPPVRTAQGSLLQRIAADSGALEHLRGLATGDTADTSLQRQEIRRFQEQHPADTLATLQRQILGRPGPTTIGQRDDAQTLRACGGGGSAPAPTVTFPTMTTIAADAAVERERAADWTAGLSDYKERSGMIMWNSATSAYAVVNKRTGTEDGVNPGAPPPDSGTTYCVGHYHQHPPIRPGRPGTFPVGASAADTRYATANNCPGIVRDYTDTTRTVVTDYQYGPSRRT